MDNEKPEQITIEEELHVCPECGYEDGFHTSFVWQAKEQCKIALICPSYHARFDPNWIVSI